MACKHCNWPYPDELLNNGVCGICGLAAVNAVHGMRRQQFSEGSIAEDLRWNAVQWRKKHPNAKPAMEPK